MRGASLRIFGSGVINTALGFAAIVYFSRELGAAQMGVFFLFEAVTGFLRIPADFGLRGAVEKRISEVDDGRSILTTALAIKTVPILGASALVLFFSDQINGYVGTDVALFVVGMVVLSELAELERHVLLGEHRGGHTATLEIVRQSGWIGTGVPLVLAGYGVEALIYGRFVGTAGMLVTGRYLSSTGYGAPSLDWAYSLVDYAKYNIFSNVQGYFYSWVDVAIIGLFLTQAEVGAYETAWKITEATIILSNAVALVLLPEISSLHAKGKIRQIEDAVTRALSSGLILVIPAFVGSIFVARPLLTYVFGEEFGIAWLVLIVLMGEKIFQAMYRIFKRTLLGLDRPNLVTRAAVFTLVLNLILNYSLVQVAGINGVAVATAVSFLTGTLLTGVYLSRYIDVGLPLREFGWFAVSAVLMGVVLGGLQTVAPVRSAATLVLYIAISALVYVCSIASNRTLRRRIFGAVSGALGVG
jgi:O-antigen/teichoic acid export membrane protein